MTEELVYHCTLYLQAKENETEEQAIERIERILDTVGIMYQNYEAELREQ